MRPHLAIAASLAALAGCDFSVPDIAEVPENPTYERDVKPLLDDHCNLCHSSPSNRGAPGDFRLDVYEIPGSPPLKGSRHGGRDREEREERDKSRFKGAYEMAEDIIDEVEDGEMPPAAEWGDGVGPNGRAMLRRWVEQGAPR